MPLVLVAAIPEIIEVIGFIFAGIGLAYFVVPPLVDLLRKIPIVGEALAGIAWSTFQGQAAVANRWVGGNAEPLVQAIFAPVAAFLDFLNLTFKWAGSVTQSLLALAQVAGGTAGNVGHRLADVIIAVAQHTIQIGDIIDAMTRLAGTLRTGLTVTIPSLIATAITAAEVLFHTALRVEQTARIIAITQVTTLANDLFTAAEQLIKVGDQVLAHELAHTAAALGAAIVAAEAVGVAYTDGVAAHLNGELVQIRNVAIPASLAIALTAVEAVATQIDTLDRECITPTCSALGAGLDLFTLLQQGVELLLLVTLLQLAIHDPERAAAELVGGVDEVVGWANGVLSAIGVRV